MRVPLMLKQPDAMIHDSPDVRVQIAVAAGRLGNRWAAAPAEDRCECRQRERPADPDDHLQQPSRAGFPRMAAEILTAAEATKRSSKMSVTRRHLDSRCDQRDEPHAGADRQGKSWMRLTMPGDPKTRGKNAQVASSLQSVVDAFSTRGVKPADAAALFDEPLRATIAEHRRRVNRGAHRRRRSSPFGGTIRRRHERLGAIIADRRQLAGAAASELVGARTSKDPANIDAFVAWCRRQPRRF